MFSKTSFTWLMSIKHANASKYALKMNIIINTPRRRLFRKTAMIPTQIHLQAINAVQWRGALGGVQLAVGW
jgi:hypothetical protein